MEKIKVDKEIEIEEYNDNTFAFRLKIYHSLLSDGYDYITSKCYEDRDECMKDAISLKSTFEEREEDI